MHTFTGRPWRVGARRGFGMLCVAAAMLALGSPAGAAQDVLASGELRIVGVQLFVAPATQTVPRNQATALTTQLVDSAHPATALTDPSLDDCIVKGELSGPGLDGTQTLSTRPGDALPIPPLLASGTYVVDRLRLERCAGDACATSTFILPASPAVATLSVIGQVIVTSVASRPLSLDEIQDRGIVIDDSSFSAYEFTFGLATESGAVPINLDVLMPADDTVRTGAGGAVTLPVSVPMLDVPNIDAAGLLLEAPPIDFGEPVEIPPIPAVIVIPGNVAFLHQFFQVIVLVSNAAPPGSRLVLTGASATMTLPPGADGIAHSADDPLVPARTGGSSAPAAGSETTAIHNKTTATADFGPGEDGTGELLVEGRQEGTYRIEVAIDAQLLGLPVGPVPLKGSAAGTVLVRNPSFALTFSHPEVVRAGEPYSLFVTVHNTSAVAAQDVTLALDPGAVIGATLVASKIAQGPNPDAEPAKLGTVVIPTIPPNDTATAEFALIARNNGQVTATGFASSTAPSGQPELTASFTLRAGVGDLGIPLSPESLILPSYVNELPPTFFAAALRVLGLAHSAATAPPGLPGAMQSRPSKQLVEQRAQEIATAGLRIRIGEPLLTSLGDAMLDWLGDGTGTDTSYDPGFDEILRSTAAGHELERAWAEAIAGSRATGDGRWVTAYQQELAAAEQYRPSFVSVAVAGDARLTLTDDHARTTSGCAGAGTRCAAAQLQRDIPSAFLLGFGDAQLALLGRSGEVGFVDAQIDGSGAAEVSILLPTEGGQLQQLVWANLQLESGAPLTFRLTPGQSAVLIDGRPALPSSVRIYEPNAGPRIVGVRQLPESDPAVRGRVVALLYDRDIDPRSVQASGFILRYAGAQAGATTNTVKQLKLLSRNRLLLIEFASSVSRFFEYALTSSGATSPAGTAQIPDTDTRPVVPDFPTPPGGIVSGFVRKGSGEALAFTPVELRESLGNDLGGNAVEIITGQTATGADGYYRFDFVGQSHDGPFRVIAQDPDTGQYAQRQSTIAQEGQELRLDLLMLGLGHVTGRIVDAVTGAPLAAATVHVFSRTDERDVEVPSAADGRFTADNVAVGNLLVSADITLSDGTQITGSVAARLETAGASAEVTVPVFGSSGAVEGVVFEAGDGATLRPVEAGVTVAVFDDAQHFERDVTTDASGHFLITGVQTGDVHVRALRQDTAEEVTLDATIGPNITTPIDLILPGTGSLVGTVLYPDGQPARNVAVIAGTSLVRTAADGSFVVERVGTGHQTVLATNDLTGAQAVIEIDISAPGTAVPVTIVLPGTASIRGVLRDASGTVQSGVQVLLWAGPQGFLRTTTDASGAYAFTNLPVGTDYTLQVSAPDGDGQAQTVHLDVHGQQLVSDLTFRGLGTATGVVLDPDGFSPRSTQVIVSYRRFDNLGRLQEARATISSDQLVASDLPSTGTCGARCADGTANCSGRFLIRIPAGLPYRIQALSPFNGEPAVVTAILDSAGAVNEHCLTLGHTGTIRGTVFLANGARAGAGIEVTYAESAGGNERVVLTDANGDFCFPLLPPRPFTLTARDPASGNRGIVRGSLITGDDAVADVSLLGQGSVTVHVVDGAAQPVANALVQLTSGSPVAHLVSPFPMLLTGSDGVVRYTGVPEGEFSVTASEPVSLTGGRSGGAIVEDLASTEVAVVLAASGTVTGTVFDATGTIPLAFAQLRLAQSGSPGAYASSDASGAYVFPFVPLAGFTLEVFDPRTGRIGRGSGALNFATEVVTLDVALLPIGTATGTVVRPSGEAVGAAHVELASLLFLQPGALVRDLSLFGPGTLITTTNLDGAYTLAGVPQGDFTVRATDPLTGAYGSSSGRVNTDGETVLADITLAGRGRVSGTVFLADGSTPVAFATVSLQADNGRIVTQSDVHGRYEFSAVPLGRVTVTAREQGGNDGGTASTDLAGDGDAVSLDVSFVGTGSISGAILTTAGDPIDAPAQLTLIRRDLSPLLTAAALPAMFTTFSDAGGHFRFDDIPAGSFTVTAELLSGGVSLAGNASGTVAADGQRLDDLHIVIEAFASVAGRVLRSDGERPAVSAAVALSGRSDHTGQQFDVSTLADGDGWYSFGHLPLGPFRITATDPSTHGLGIAAGRIDTAGAALALPPIVLDDTTPAVVGVSPRNGATCVAVTTPIVITFSGPVDPACITADGIVVRAGATVLSGTLAVSADRTEASFTPAGGLPELRLVAVEVNPNVHDYLGRPLAAVFRSAFETADMTAPSVVSTALVQGQPVIEWDETLSARHGTVAVTRVQDGASVAGTLDLSNGNTRLIFKPAAELPPDETFEVTVAGWTDLFRNLQQPDPYVAYVSTTDHTGPRITLSSTAAADVAIAGQTVVLTATPLPGSDDVSAVDFFADDGQLIASDSTAPFTHTFVANAPITVTAVATDFAGNRGDPVTITIGVVSNQPPTVQLTSPPTGTVIGTGRVLEAIAAATDDLGLSAVELDVQGTQLLLTQVVYFPPNTPHGVATFTIPIPAAAQPDDNLVLSVSARDIRELTSVPSAITVRIADVTPPTARITSLSGDFTVDPGVTVPVTVHADDAVGVAFIRFHTEGAVTMQSSVAILPPKATADATFPLSLPADLPQASTITLIAEALDAAGNLGSAPRMTLTVRDALPPSLVILSPAPGTEQIAGSAIPVTVQATDNGTVAEVDFFVDGRLVSTARRADVAGHHMAVLIAPRNAISTTFAARASDAQGNTSPLASVILPLRPNLPPIADAGPDRTVLTNVRATLSGAACSDPDGSPLTYRWRLITRPPGSTAALGNATFRDADLLPDVAGTYTFGLTVNDGVDDSAEDTVTLTAVVATPSPTPTATDTPTATATPTDTATQTGTPSVTPTRTATSSPTVTPTATCTSTPTGTPTITSTPTVTPTPTATFTPTVSPTVTSTPTISPTATVTSTATPTEVAATGIVYCVNKSGGLPNPTVCKNNTVYTNIQAAVDLATDGDEIRIANDTYTGSASSVVTVGKALFITGGFTSGASGWTISGAATGTVIDGQGTRLGVTVSTSSPVSVSNLTLNNGGISTGSGTLRVNSGTINLKNGGTSSGTFVVAAGTTIEFPTGAHTLSAGTTIGGAGCPRITGGVLTVSGAVTAQNFELASGTLNGSGTLTTTGTFKWTGGTMSGSGSTTIAAGATLLMSSASYLSFDTRTISNQGSATWSGSGNILASAGAVFNNAGTFLAQSDQMLLINGVSTATFTNSGSFTKAGTTGTTEVRWAFNNTGITDVETGTLTFTAGGSASGGAFAVAAGTALQLTGGTYVLNSGTTVTGAGFARVAGAVATVGSSVTAQNFELASGTLNGSGTLTTTGTFKWTGGTMSGSGNTTIAPGATLSISSTNVLLFDTRTISNQGSATWSGSGSISASAGAVFNNAGTFLVQNDQMLLINGVSTATFTNSGSFTKAGTTGTTEVRWAFNNTGITDVETGTLTFTAGGSASGGAFAVAAGTALQLTGGTYVLNSGTSITGAGFARVAGAMATVAGSVTAQNFELASGTLNGSGTLTTTSTFKWTGGTMNGSGNTTIAPGATLLISSTSTLLFNTRTISNQGSATWSGSGSIAASAGAVFNNAGTFLAQNDQMLAINGVSTATFTNSGSFTKAGTTGTTEVRWAFSNVASGTIDIQSGVVSLTGNYAPASTTALGIKIGGLSAGTQFGQLKIGGTATLAGTLNISLTPGYVPNIGDRFPILTYASRTGTFSAMTGSDLGNGGVFTPDFSSGTSLALVVTQATPTPTPANTRVSTVTPTATPTPAATPTATPAPTETPTPTPTPTP